MSSVCAWRSARATRTYSASYCARACCWSLRVRRWDGFLQFRQRGCWRRGPASRPVSAPTVRCCFSRSLFRLWPRLFLDWFPCGALCARRSPAFCGPPRPTARQRGAGLRQDVWCSRRQIAVCLILLMAAGLLLRTLRNFATQNLGMQADELAGLRDYPARQFRQPPFLSQTARPRWAAAGREIRIDGREPPRYRMERQQ